jgi:N-acyl homoserine lactone hydrolase
MVTRDDVRRLDYGYFRRPAAETGTGAPRIEPVVGYLVRHPDGLVLFDTGIGEVGPEVEAHYRPTRRELPKALAAAGVGIDDVTLVVNCHLHFDHCGGNPLLAGRPVITQATELATAREHPAYAPELVDFPGAGYQELDGEAEILPGVWVVPTPGHTAGHQSLAVRCSDGTVILAGQSHDHAAGYTYDQLGWAARHDYEPDALPPVPAWIERLQRFDPARVLFAHDLAVWEPA